MRTSFNHYFVLLACCTALVLTGCEYSQNPSLSKEAEMTAADASASPETNEKQEPAKAPVSLVIKNAEVRFQVKDLQGSTQRIEQTVRQADALLTNTSQTSTGDEQQTDFVIRVRPAQFSRLLDQLQKESVKLDYRNLSSDDVGLEYVDVQARIQAKRKVEERYLALLAQAKDLKEIFEVEQQIQAVREEIESAEARLRYLKDQTSYSTIRLSIYQLVPMSFTERIGLGTRLYNAIGTGWEFFLTLVVGLCYLWPAWVLMGGFWALRKKGLV
jgi:hypothetical protein